MSEPTEESIQEWRQHQRNQLAKQLLIARVRSARPMAHGLRQVVEDALDVAEEFMRQAERPFKP